MTLLGQKAQSSEETKRLKALVAEMKARGIDIPAAIQLAKKRWPVDNNGYFTKNSGKFYEPTEAHKNFIASSARFIGFVGSRGSGKALAIDTLIPTINGWKRMEEIEAGDIVFDEGGNPTKVLSTSPVMHNHDCYEITFDEGSKVIADGEHFWSIDYLFDRRKSFSTPRIFTTKDLASRKLKTGSNYIYRIPTCPPLKFLEKELQLHPYLLGVWLGDGSRREAKVYIHDKDIEIINRIVALGYPTKKLNEYCSWSLADRGNKSKVKVQETLRDIGVLNDKHIPNEYLTSSVEHRIALLQGLMDTDGTVSKRGHCSFDSCSEILAKDVYKLVSSLGIKASLKLFYSTCNGEKHKYYKVVFTSSSISVFSLDRKKKRQKMDSIRTDIHNRSIIEITQVKSVPVKCIQVASASKLFLMGYSCMPTHNSAAGAQKALRKIKEGNSGAVLNPDF